MGDNQSRTDGCRYLEKLHRYFRTWFSDPRTAITIERLESRKSRRLNSGCKPTTLLRDFLTPPSVVCRGVKLGHLNGSPIRHVDKPALTADPECACRSTPKSRDCAMPSRSEMPKRAGEFVAAGASWGPASAGALQAPPHHISLAKVDGLEPSTQALRAGRPEARLYIQ
jgi:hypothetical protein